MHHFIEYWSNSSLSKSWVSKTNDSFEVRSSENGMLSLNITELLVFNMNLTTGLTSLAGTKSKIVGNEVTSEVSGTKEDLGFLWGIGCGSRCQVIVASLFGCAAEVDCVTKDPGVR